MGASAFLDQDGWSCSENIWGREESLVVVRERLWSNKASGTLALSHFTLVRFIYRALSWLWAVHNSRGRSLLKQSGIALTNKSNGTQPEIDQVSATG